MLMITSSIVQAAQFTLNVVDNNGIGVAGFRYILQEDTTFPVDPANPATNPDELLSMSFHASNHPPARSATGVGLSGNSDTTSATIADVAAGRYYVSVLPYAGYSISGAQVVAGTDDPVTVVVQKQPIPTAQIAIYVFHDDHPINGVPDLPEELNPNEFIVIVDDDPNDDNPPVITEEPNPDFVDWTQFSLFLEEPAGRYGIAGGQVIQDAFGNPLGTTYVKGCDADGNVEDPDDPFTDYGCLNPDGSPQILVEGDGTLHPDENGFLMVENIPPAKYGIIMIPPANQGWQQTSTIEGTKVIDAWVKANEPAFFVEFGLPGPHAFVGFVKSSADYVEGEAGGFPPLPGGFSVSGTVTDMHMSRSPNFQFFSGRPFPQCWVGLNESTVGGLGQGLYAAPCAGDSSFQIDGVPAGSYQLAIFDANMDVVFAALPFTVDEAGTCNGGGSCNFGDVPVFNWFARLNTGVFNDDDQDGFWDPTENGIGPDTQDVTLRWRDGSIYQNFPTDNGGMAPFDEVFPFFHWLVAEVSFASKKATGATFVIDAGGAVNPPDAPAFDELDPFAYPSFSELTPQPQVCTAAQSNNLDDPDFNCTVGAVLINPNTITMANPDGNNLSRTETGQVLTTAFQGFLGQTSVMQFGKTDYVTFTEFDFTTDPVILPEFVGENGGISGIVFYATTRAEDDPQFAAAEEWEPGVPRVQIALYADGDIDCFPQGDFPASDCDIDWNGNGMLEADDGSIDDANQNGIPGELADVDNYPLGNFPGPEDVDSGFVGVFDYGDALAVTWTDSWDDSLPTGCQGQNQLDFDGDGVTTEAEDSRCFDGLRNFNQVRPGVFDGGYAFNNYDTARLPAAIQTKLADFYANRVALVGDTTAGIRVLPDEWILPADYIVEAATPAGLKLMREHHKNVDYGDSYIPSTQAIAASCVGDMDLVPAYLAMATKDGSGNTDQLILGVEAITAPYAGTMRPLCDRKKLSLSSAQNAPVDFFLMSDVPLMANVSGVILNDLGNEFDPNSPAFGEKFAPPLVPVAFYDWNGNLVSRIYSDTYGRYNAVVPSTYTANLPMPSGMSPNMLVSCMNDAGPIEDPNNPGQFIIDPFYNPQFSQFCYTFQYMPAVITYLDTPVEPIAAFAGTANGLDCERPTQTPMIDTVSRNGGLGGPFALLGDTITITSLGMTTVPNPDWDGVNLALKNIMRDYSFGVENKVYLENADGILIRIKLDSEGPAIIVAQVAKQNQNTGPDLVSGEYQLVVENTDNGSFTPMGVTLTIGTAEGTGEDANGNPFNVVSVPSVAYPTIQSAIGDPTKGQPGVAPGDLILVEPGIYNEMVIMWKPVKLQGWGASSVVINARQSPTEGLAAWRRLASVLVSGGEIDKLPGQVLAPLGFPALAEALFPSEEGAGIFVAGVEDTGDNTNSFVDHPGARIDGLTVIGASQGGGIVLNGYNALMNVSNNRVTSNSGIFGGGVRVGHHNISHEDLDLGLVYDDAQNDMVRIHHNHVAQNGNTNGTGGGLSMHTGADDYKVQKNWLCGNFSKGHGGGIAHFGLSDKGLIEDNLIIFNEVFNQMPGTAPSGAGVFIGGQPALQLDGETELMLSPGSGSVVIDANIIRGNLAGAGDGAGIAVKSTNGLDVSASLGDSASWYQVGLYNNMVNNNVAGVAGALTLSDALMVDIRHNSVANNDSTATGSQAFLPGVPNMSVPQPAGVVSRLHSPVMADLIDLVEVAVNLDFSDPVFMANIVFQNRSFYWLNSDPNAAVGTLTTTGIYPAFCDPATIDPANPATCDVTQVEDYTYDMAVMNGVVSADPLSLNPLYSLLTANVGNPVDATNVYEVTSPGIDLLNPVDAVFENSYFNVPRDNLVQNEFKTLQTAAAFDEGGNFIQVAYSPLSLVEPFEGPLFDYHLAKKSPAIDQLLEIGGQPPTSVELLVDIDGDARVEDDRKTEIDIGADEL
jgi:hypothetical protein